jgi:glycosyltransferase involved in cell wall biosynthesis
MDIESAREAMRATRVTLVVPCFNEAKRLDVAAFTNAISTMPWLDFIFVNDGSADNTEEVLDTLRSAHEGRVSVLSLPHNMGKAEAVRRGLLQANAKTEAPICGFWDADLSAPLHELVAMRRVFTEHPHVAWVWGIRLRSLGRLVTRQARRHYLGRLFATAASVVVALPIYDSQCGAKLFRTGELLSAAIATPFLSRWIFDVEMIARASMVHGRHQLSRAVREHPLDYWEHRAGSRLRPGDFVRAAGELFRIARRYRA